MRKRKLKIIGLTALMVLITFVTTLSFVNKAQASNAMRPGTAASSQGEDDPEVPPSTADHSKFEILQQDFATGPEVTAACLSCHTEASTQVMHTTHWTWEYVNETTGQTVGKKTELNNFCIGTSSNEPRCTSCHIGYGWEDDSFDFDVAENVDCLICHDTTGTYTKPATKAGLPDPDVDLSFIAQSIGETSRANCLACHANGGGGDAVKHGDIDTSLIEPNHDLDVHMDADGLNFSCSECHITDSHAISGSRYEHDENVKTCADCHDAAPHEEETLNTHAEKLACQSCHIPEFGKIGKRAFLRGS